VSSDPTTAGSDEAFEALADCEACLVESAVVELIAARGVVLERRCRLCLREHRDGALVHAGEPLRGDPDAGRRALARWAKGEGDPEVERFVLAHFGGLGLDAVAERLARGERVETCFDAIAWLFPGVGAVGGGARAPAPEVHDTLETGPPRFTTTEPRIQRADPSRPDVRRARASVPPISIPVTHESIPRHLQPLRVSARALASVMLADGEASPADRAFLDRTLAAWGHPPLEPADLAIWRPHDLGWPHDPGAVVEAMCRLAYVDGQRDATEWRVVREFARAWGVSLDAVEALGARLRAEHQQGLPKLLSTVRALFIR
jgi:hypothetical protein